MLGRDAYRSDIEAELTAARDFLAPLEAGEMFLEEGVGSFAMQDTTKEVIEEYRERIARCERLLAQIDAQPA
jgi:hypothetical protein